MPVSETDIKFFCMLYRGRLQSQVRVSEKYVTYNYEIKIKRNFVNNDYHTFQESASSPTSKRSAPAPGLEECHICHRFFASDRISKHESICKKTSTKKRKVFDPTKMRMEGTEAEPYLRQVSGKVKRKAPAPVPVQVNPNSLLSFFLNILSFIFYRQRKPIGERSMRNLLTRFEQQKFILSTLLLVEIQPTYHLLLQLIRRTTSSVLTVEENSAKVQLIVTFQNARISSLTSLANRNQTVRKL